MNWSGVIANGVVVLGLEDYLWAVIIIIIILLAIIIVWLLMRKPKRPTDADAPAEPVKEALPKAEAPPVPAEGTREA